MKFRKTPSAYRTTFTYVDALGVKRTIDPTKECSNGEIVDPKWIAMLHRMYDREVENNANNTRVPVQKWEKPLLEDWKRRNPEKDLPSRYILPLNAVGTDEGGEKNDMEIGSLIAKASLAAFEEKDEDLELLNEAVTMLPSDQQMLYHRVVKEEEKMCVIAKEEGVEESTIRHRMKVIRMTLEKLVKEIQG